MSGNEIHIREAAQRVERFLSEMEPEYLREASLALESVSLSSEPDPAEARAGAGEHTRRVARPAPGDRQPPRPNVQPERGPLQDRETA